MSIKYEIIHLCEIFGIRLDPDMGQNFLTSEGVLEKEVEIADVKDTDIVLDIGAGFGFLTEKIAAKAKKVYAVELDRRIVEAFKYRLGELISAGKIELVVGDFLKYDIPKDVNKIVANPPYYISSELIVKIAKELYQNKNFEIAVLMLQKEFVRRLLSKPCSRNWGRISATFNYYFEADYTKVIPKTLFFPRPEVDSMIIRFRFRRDRELLDFKIYERLTEILFQGPNKKLRRILKQLFKKYTPKWSEVIGELSKEIDVEKRIRCLTVEDIEKIGEKVLDMGIIF